MRIALAALVSFGVVHGAAAEPCPMFGLESRPLNDNAVVSREGGIVVGEVPAMVRGTTMPTADRSAWKTKAKGKAMAATISELAPGLVVYRPSGATAFEVVDGGGRLLAKAKVMAKEAELLAAPDVRAITTGTSRSIHPSTFVNVELGTPPPKGAVALVVGPAKGPAHSWGQVVPGASAVTVYTTGGGCILLFPYGTVVSQPEDQLLAFWVDVHGRRSRMSSVVVVQRAP